MNLKPGPSWSSYQSLFGFTEVGDYLITSAETKVTSKFALAAQDELTVVSCNSCSKSILQPAFVTHLANCKKIKKMSKVALSAPPPPTTTTPTTHNTLTAPDSPSLSSLKKKRKKDKTVEEGAPVEKKIRLDLTKLEGLKDKPSEKPAKPEKKIKVPKLKGKLSGKSLNESLTVGPIDLDKQCGVISEGGQQCTRSITCKIHSVSSKRAVQGRTYSYDILCQMHQSHRTGNAAKALVTSSHPPLGLESLENATVTEQEAQALFDSIRRFTPTPAERVAPYSAARTWFLFRNKFAVVEAVKTS